MKVKVFAPKKAAVLLCELRIIYQYIGVDMLVTEALKPGDANALVEILNEEKITRISTYLSPRV